MKVKTSMPPVGSTDARLLLLGSLPGDASLAAQRYYAHPTNQFWRLLGDTLGERLAPLDYPERLARLAARGVALWDVIAQAQRAGSLDGAIRTAKTNALKAFMANHPRLKAVGLNGLSAQFLARRLLGDMSGIEIINLPSSSAANTKRLDWKAEQWRVLAPFADPLGLRR